MPLIRNINGEPVRLKLVRDRTRVIKQGHPWIFRDWLAELPAAEPGSRAIVRDQDGSLIAFGMYDPISPLAVRICAVEQERLDDLLITKRLESALVRRQILFKDSRTTGYRLLNGEGDGLPGLVCDRYGDHAVIKLDGEAPSGFWDLDGIAEWLVNKAKVKNVYLKFRSDSDARGRAIVGDEPSGPIRFLENGLHLQANIVHGQKTGFFFDQRDNRARIETFSNNRSVLNLFGYTGGFSVYAGRGGARHVTTVDLAKPAILEAEENWRLNKLPSDRHSIVAADAFEYLEQMRKSGRSWNLIVVDPPSFAQAERQVEKAKESYQALFGAAISVLEAEGIIALSSCSSHISPSDFLEICQKSFSKARRRGTVLGIYGQPEDHPFPLPCTELQYLKFILLSVGS